MRTLQRFLIWATAAVMFVAGIVQTVEVGDVMTLPEVQLLDGTHVSGDAWRGHPVIIATWASWYPFYALQNPRLQKLYDTTRSMDLRILIISTDVNPRLTKDYVAKRGFTFPVAMEAGTLCVATGPRKGLFELLVLDAEGRMARKEVGEILEDDMADLARYAHNPKQ